MNREHKCPKCGTIHKVSLPLKPEWLQDPNLYPLVKTWQSVYLKLGGQFCLTCRSETDRARTQKLLTIMAPGSLDTLSESLVWASQFQDAGIKLAPPPPVPKAVPVPAPRPSQTTEIVLPRELLEFCTTVPAYLARIAEKLETFQDFSNVWSDDDEPEGADDFDDVICPYCGKDDDVYEHLELDKPRDDGGPAFNFYCTRCSLGFDEGKEDESIDASTKPTTEVKPYQKVLEEEEDHERETRLVDTETYQIEDLDGNPVKSKQGACKGGVCKC